MKPSPFPMSHADLLPSSSSSLLLYIYLMTLPTVKPQNPLAPLFSPSLQLVSNSDTCLCSAKYDFSFKLFLFARNPSEPSNAQLSSFLSQLHQSANISNNTLWVFTLACLCLCCSLTLEFLAHNSLLVQIFFLFKNHIQVLVANKRKHTSFVLADR